MVARVLKAVDDLSSTAARPQIRTERVGTGLRIEFRGPEGSCPADVEVFPGHMVLAVGIGGVTAEYGFGSDQQARSAAVLWLTNILQLVFSGRLSERVNSRGGRALRAEAFVIEDAKKRVVMTTGSPRFMLWLADEEVIRDYAPYS